MREIKFRIWGKLPYGKDEEVMTYLPHWEVFDESDLVFRTDDETFWIDSSNSKKEGIILMQYTGLKDKNGKEIYEGDICFRNGHFYEIDFYDGAFGIKRSNDIMASITSMFHGHALYNYVSELEVKGNIYETPELIK